MLIKQVIKNQIFEGFLLVRASEQRTSANGSKFLDMTLCDISGDVNAKMWDGTVDPPKPGTVIKVRAMMQEYNGHNQLRVDKLRASNPRDNIDMKQIVPCAPRPGEEMLKAITDRVDRFVDPTLQKIVRLRLEECGKALIYYPAATRLHHAERSGLLHHTSTMLRMADAVCDVYDQLDRDLLLAGVILHDLCKIEEIDADQAGIANEYTREGQLLGHIIMGVSAIDRACEKLEIKGEIPLMLKHMILAHHDLPEYGSPKPPMFPEAEMLHILDLMDARMFEMTRAIEQVRPGGFTDRIWSLERRLYRRQKPPVRPAEGDEGAPDDDAGDAHNDIKDEAQNG